MKSIPEALTFDDVLLIPQFSNVLPAQTNIQTRLTDKITLNVPIMSAAMDTLTEHKMSIALSCFGGLGVIHKNMSLEHQSKEVEKVKNASFSVNDFPDAIWDESGRLMTAAAIGTGDDTKDRVEALIQAGVDVLVLDSAHGHSQGILNKLSNLKSIYPDIPIVAGNIVTAEAAKDLIDAGADVLKVGIGPGSICTTRVVAGVGVPQITALMMVSEIAKKYNIPVICDGGIKYSGDIVKALAAGGDIVMLGSLLAGTEEACGETIEINNQQFKAYRGMGSEKSMKLGSKDRYFQSENQKFTAEGIESVLAYKGSMFPIVSKLVGGLRAGMGYCGAHNISELQEKSSFVRITNAGLNESHPHILTRENSK
ncbi:MAG: IMP dehydrogenase [Chitinophagales bacterium]|nr:IMP dehydrogenase [Chitinophagales bacterium]